MSKLFARIVWDKIACKDNWDKGADVESWVVQDGKTMFSFTDADDFKNKLADYVCKNFDVNKDDFLKYATNEIENNRFDYNQNEDSNSNRTELSESNPDGYLCDYTFWVDVVQEVKFNF